MNNNEVYDIAIIGGGLAGLSLAIQCAGAGYKTALFEKEQYPFHKVCGEYISNESYPFLERLGVHLSALSLPKINKLILSDISGKAYHFPLGLGGFGISRYCLDNLLYEIALSKGVTVFTKTKVNDVVHEDDDFIITTSSKNYKAKIVCGAWGKRSNLDVQWKRPFAQQKPNKLNNYIGIKYHIQYSFAADAIALHNFKDGYCGISKIEDDRCCLCYLTTANNLKSNNNSIAEMEKTVLSRNPALKKIFSEAVFLYKQPLAISQVSFEKKTRVENGVLMLGDTAGLITPLCGNGMSMAMHSSVLAFQNVHSYLQQKTTRSVMEKNYETQWQQQLGRRLLVGRTVQRLFGGNTSTALFLRAMSLFPSLAKGVIKATHGEPF